MLSREVFTYLSVVDPSECVALAPSPPNHHQTISKLPTLVITVNTLRYPIQEVPGKVHIRRSDVQNQKMTFKCVHRGCGKAFEDPEAKCHYHPGPPVFHEGQKGVRASHFRQQLVKDSGLTLRYRLEMLQTSCSNL